MSNYSIEKLTEKTFRQQKYPGDSVLFPSSTLSDVIGGRSSINKKSVIVEFLYFSNKAPFLIQITET